MWLTQCDQGELTQAEVTASMIDEYEARIAALERKVGQLTMEIDMQKKLLAFEQSTHKGPGFAGEYLARTWKISEMKNDQYVQYGCGWLAPSGWKNFDASPTLRFERLPLISRLYTKNASRFPENVEYGDIIKGLPIPSESCSGVYCSHTLEHLSLEDFKTALLNTKRILRAGGIFRFVVPDLEYSIRQYVSNSSDNAAHKFMNETCLGQEKRLRGFKDFFVSWLGNSRHLWMWDYKSIESELQKVGFVDIRKASFGDSADPKYQEVEEEERWNNCLGVECRRPV